MTKILQLLSILFLSDVPKFYSVEPSKDSPLYGVDVSWPIHTSKVSTNYPWLLHNVDPDNNPVPPNLEGTPIQHLGNRQEVYENFIKGCRDYYRENSEEEGEERCQTYEEYRLYRNLMQPPSMLNFTDVGYKKIRAPDDVFKILKDFWEKNQGREYEEKWADGTTANHWEVPTTMLSVEDEELEGGGEKLKNLIWKLAEDSIREWTNMYLSGTSVYGIRIYKEGSILTHHVDRLPLISSAIINVAQDVDEDWPIEVIGHDGIARNITMEPGDMVLYESHSIIHGRPFALKGRFYANIFIHFEPLKSSGTEIIKGSEKELPFYIIPGSNGAEFLPDSEDESDDDYEYEHEYEYLTTGEEFEDVESEGIDSEDIESEDLYYQNEEL